MTELGYTPNNLRVLLKDHQLTQKTAREVLGKARSTFARYLLEVNNPNHVTMAHADWLKLLKYTKDQKY